MNPQWEQALKVFNLARTGMLLVDRNRKVLAANPSYYRITGWTPEEVSGSFCYDLHDARTGTGISLCRENCIMERGLGNGRQLPRVRVLITSREGLFNWVDISHTLLNGNGGSGPCCLLELSEELDVGQAYEHLRSFLDLQLRPMNM